MGTMPTVENASAWFDAKTVAHRLDVGDVESASATAEYDEDSTRFGSIPDHEVEKVTVSSQPAGLCVSFVVSRWSSSLRSVRCP